MCPAPATTTYIAQPSSSAPSSAMSRSMRAIRSAAASSERMPEAVASWIALFSTLYFLR